MLAAILATTCGCVVFEVGVRNPVPGLTTVAVAPFFNLSQEPIVDGRRVALAYYTELQKTPGFQVVPVGVVEQAMFDNKIDLSSPQAALRLAEILKVDAVVVGAVTDYSPYYPPRIGMQVSWYSPKCWTFFPGPNNDDFARKSAAPRRRRFHFLFHQDDSCEPIVEDTVFRGQNPDKSPRRSAFSLPNLNLPEWLGGSPRTEAGPPIVPDDTDVALDVTPDGLFAPPPGRTESPRLESVPTPSDLELLPPPVETPILRDSLIVPPNTPNSMSQPSRRIELRPSFSEPAREPGRDRLQEPFATAERPYHSADRTERMISASATTADCECDPSQPLMSYTRLFDGADPRLTAKLRDYIELSGDLRSGGWEGYLQRSEDFLRFTSHVMIVEMLQLHGGETRRRVVIMHRKYK
jgi:hypothetical protein